MKSSAKPRIVTLGRKTLCTARYFKFIEEKYRMAGRKKPSTHYVLDHPGAVVILPYRTDGSILMVRQYRHSVRSMLLELPAGTIERGEKPLPCAKREICEEVGYAASRWKPLGTLFPAPGFCNEVQYLYLASNLKPKRLAQDEDEFIRVVPMSASAIERAIRAGRIVDAKTIATFYRARLLGLIA